MKKIVISLLLSLFTLSAYAAPKAELWPYWNQADDSNPAQISHAAWQQFLERYLVSRGQHNLLRYAEVSQADHQALKGYIRSLTSIDPRSYAKKEQYAYWVNLYNALTVDLILSNYPVKSITKLGGFFSFGPWGKELVRINSESLSLNDIEHRILRPIWQDPRTHYAVNCASLGCPNLQANAFTAENSEALLDKAARQFINSDKGVILSGSELQLSSIYEWFSADFGGQEGVMRHLANYRSQPLTAAGKIKYDYDWSLNEVKE